jgi:hypothetical protein
MVTYTFETYPHANLLVLHFLQNYPEFVPIFIDKAPSIAADIRSFVGNPNCSCRYKIEKFAVENVSLCKEVVKNFIDANKIDFNLNAFNNGYFKLKNLSGRVIETTVEKWPALAEKLAREGASYKSFSVLMKPDGSLMVFFL